MYLKDKYTALLRRIYPTNGLPDGYAELVKLYLSPAARGKGIGNTLML